MDSAHGNYMAELSGVIDNVQGDYTEDFSESYEEAPSTLVDQLLKEQRTLTAVDRFSQKHSDVNHPLQQEHYKDLIPIKKPSVGEQYSFEVNLDKCTGCKACVVACHSLNGLHEKESWRDIGSIRGVVDGVVEQQTVTSACHHCADPGCLSGCPVGAYEKMEDTGVVRHLDDQCIGCQYCSLKCPYDVPKYDDSLGIVRKCDMCHERLAEGEAPACVQSCPNGAISIQLISTETIKANAADGGSMIAGAFRSDYTLPSTNFLSKRKLDDTLQAADEMDLTPSHNHAPLVWMLMLTQVAVGISMVDGVGRLIAGEYFSDKSAWLILGAVLLGKVGLVSSLLHLGSPLGAWRVFLGLKTSWLSREIVIFGAWMPALIGYAALLWWPSAYGYLPYFVKDWLPSTVPELLLTASSLTAVGLGLLSVFCSVMVYVDTQRDFWRMKLTLGRFFGTAVLGGFAGLIGVGAVLDGGLRLWCAVGFALACVFKSALEISLIAPARHAEWSFAKKSALIQLRSLRPTLSLRWGAMAGAVVLAALSAFVPLLAIAAFWVILVGEWLERKIFFEAVVTLKMPGELNKPTH